MGVSKTVGLAVAILMANAVPSIAPSWAAPWPQRTVTLITPMAAGTATDFAARLFANKLSERWGKPVIVENRPGGDQIVGTDDFTRRKDDHVLLFSTSAPIAVEPVIHEKLPYDPVRDLLPISLASNVFVAIAAKASLNVTSIDGLVKLARSQPGKINWASAPGLTQYVFAAFDRRAGLETTFLPYSTLGPALQDLSDGRIQIMAHSLSALLPVIQAGKARLLIVNNSQRAAIAPEVPTAIEAGYPELTYEGFTGLFGWRGMPDDLRERVAADVRAAASDAGVRERLAAVGQVARGSSPAEFASALVQQRATTEAAVRITGLMPTN